MARIKPAHLTITGTPERHRALLIVWWRLNGHKDMFPACGSAALSTYA